MKLLSPYHRRPRNLWVSGRLTLFVTILLFRSVIKCHFPSFQLDRMQFRFSVIHHHRYVQTRDTVGRKTNLHARFLCVRPRCRDSWHETHPSLGHSVSVTWSQAPQPASVSAPHVTETQLRSGKWYLSITGHGTRVAGGMDCRLKEQCQAWPGTIIQSSIWCHCVRRYESLRWHRIYHC